MYEEIQAIMRYRSVSFFYFVEQYMSGLSPIYWAKYTITLNREGHASKENFNRKIQT